MIKHDCGAQHFKVHRSESSIEEFIKDVSFILIWTETLKVVQIQS